MTEIAFISIGVIVQALTFSLGILTGMQIAKERAAKLTPRDPAWWHRTRKNFWPADRSEKMRAHSRSLSSGR